MLMGQLPMEIYPVFLAHTGTPEQKGHPESLMKCHLDSETKTRSALNIWLIYMPLYMSNEALRFSGRSDIINNVNENARLKNEYGSMAQVCH